MAAMWTGDDPAQGLVWDFVDSKLSSEDAAGAVCRAIKRLSEQDIPVNMSNPTAQALLAAAVTEGVLTQAQVDRLRALGAYNSTDANEQGLPLLALGHVMEALDGGA
jgi:hypothetical protein